MSSLPLNIVFEEIKVHVYIAVVKLLFLCMIKVLQS